MKNRPGTEYETSLENLMPLFQEQFQEGRSVCFSPKGISMLPMLRQGIDSVELSPLPEKLQKYDLPLYRYPSGKYLLHRIVGMEGGNYRCIGDNTYIFETVSPECMIAVVTAFRRGERRISVNAWHYKLYCRVWVGLYPLRHFAKRAIGWVKRHIKK